MRFNVQIIFGVIIVLIGIAIIFGMLFEIDLWAICFSVGLILFGVWILVRPRILPEDSDLKVRIFGDIRKRGSWLVTDQEIWLFIGDVRLDMTEAQIPDGVTNIRIIAFISDVRLRLPAETGISLSSMAFVNETHVLGKKRSNFLVPMEYKSEGYSDTLQKVSLETICFIGDIRVKQITKQEAPNIDNA